MSLWATNTDLQKQMMKLPADHVQAITEQDNVFDKCLELMVERSASYGLAWQRYGALSNLLNAARKVERLMEIWWHAPNGSAPAIHKDSLDDALDSINYLGFFIQCARDANMTGEPTRYREYDAAQDGIDGVDEARSHCDTCLGEIRLTATGWEHVNALKYEHGATLPGGHEPEIALPDDELPGMWERSDFT